MQNFGGMTGGVNVQITPRLVWFFKALKCFQTLFKSQQWRATSTSWSTSCPSSLRPSWTSMTSKIPQADVVVVALECFSALLRTVWALHCTAVRPGGTDRLFKDVDWELCDSDLIQQTLTFKIQTPTWSPTWCTAPDRTETPQTRSQNVFLKQDVVEQLRVISSALISIFVMCFAARGTLMEITWFW